MERGTTIISTEEYLELRAIRDNLETRKREIEENADKVIVHRYDYGLCESKEFITVLSKDEAFRDIGDKLENMRKERDSYRETVNSQSRKIKRMESDWIHPADVHRSIPARLRFLFTGELSRKGE